MMYFPVHNEELNVPKRSTKKQHHWLNRTLDLNSGQTVRSVV